MNNVLEKLKKENILCEIYENLNDSEKFYVGYITNFDDEMLIFESVSEDGKSDGYYCTSIDSLIQIKYKTKYLANIKKLMSFNKFKRNNLEIKDSNLFESFLNYIKSTNRLCQIELLNDYSCVLTGYILSLDSEIVTINLIDDNGEPDGVGVANINDISCVSVDTEELQKLKILEN